MAPSNLQSLAYFYPELIITAGLIAVLLLDLALGRRKDLLNACITAAALAAAFVFSAALYRSPQMPLFSGMLALDGFATFFKLVVIAAALLVALSCVHCDELEGVNKGELFVLILSAALAMTILAASINILMLYLSLEMLSITSYIMVGYLRGDRISNEAALKYLLFGAVSTGAMLYGISLLFGLTGTLNLFEVREALLNGASAGPNMTVFLFATALLIAGFGFKTASAPFHFWTPDAYTGAPTPVSAFLSVGPKAAGFAILLRFFFSGMSVGPVVSDIWEIAGGVNWPFLLIVVSGLTMTWGNLAAMFQTNLKRLLAYSSIAHAGYIMMGVVVLTGQGLKSVFAYIIVYYFMNLGAFFIVSIVFNGLKSFDIEDYAGLYKKSPFLSIAMMIFLLSLMGIPPLSGFLGKLYIFAAVIRKGLIWFAVLGMLNSVLSIFYYARVIKAMVIDEGHGSSSPIAITPLNRALVLILLIPNFLLIIVWEQVDKFAAISLGFFNWDRRGRLSYCHTEAEPKNLSSFAPLRATFTASLSAKLPGTLRSRLRGFFQLRSGQQP